MKYDISVYGACDEAVEYYKTKESFAQAWEDCRRGDWMLWIAAKMEVDEKLLLKAKLECAKTVKHLMKDQRSLDALDAAQDYVDGKINKYDDIITYTYAAYAAYAADAYAAAAADAAAADAAAYAVSADADTAAADAYAAAADAAYAAYAADAAAAFKIAREQNLLRTADICRKILTQSIKEKLGVKYEQK